MHLDLADRADRALPCGAHEPLELEDRVGERQPGVEPEVHRRRTRVVAAAVHGRVGVHIAGYRRHDPDPVPRVLQHACLLDVHLDPTREVVEDVQRLAPAVRPVAGLLRVLPEAATIVDRAKALAQVVLGHTLGHDPAPEQHLSETGALFLEEGDQLQRQAEPELLVQPAHLESRDDTHRSVVLAAVAVRVAVRADPEHALARRAVARNEGAERILADVVPDRLQLAREVVERVAVYGVYA